MKKFLKVAIPVSLIAVLFVSLLCFRFYYAHNTKLTEYFEKNSTALSDYIESFDSEKFTEKYNDEQVGEIREYDIPNELKKINIDEIKYFDSCVFFEVNVLDACCGGIYYSFNNSYADASPAYYSDVELFNLDFNEARKGVFVKGEKNTGTDWYKTEKLSDNWYYYEFH